MGTAAAGPPANAVQTMKAVYIASMTKSPCAKLITFIMPQISVRPEENSAYTAPMSRPLTITCRRMADMDGGSAAGKPAPQAGRLGVRFALLPAFVGQLQFTSSLVLWPDRYV